jgi:hypothetical protein
MTTKFHEVITNPPSGRTVPVILDHTSFGSARLLHGAAVPWAEPVECQVYFGQAQGLLRPDMTLVDLGAAYAQHLVGRPDLTAAMGARSRAGYALKTLLADEAASEAVLGVVRVLAETSKLPLVLQVPAPLRWLALTSSVAGHADPGALTPDHGESASVYVADWLRRVESVPVALLLLDGRRRDDSAVLEVVPEDLATYTPLINAADHYRWGLALRDDDQLQLHGMDAAGVILPPSFWVDQPAPQGSVLFAEVPEHAEPEHVLERLATLS